MNNKLLVAAIYLISSAALAADNNQSDHSDHAMQEHQGHSQQSQVGMTMPAATASKTIAVTLTDAMEIKFGSPLDLYLDDVVRFVVTNAGKMQHEFSISSLSERKAHVEMMKKMPNMKHENDRTLTLQPEETDELTWHFTGKQRVIFSCNIPGHSEAGMLKMAMLRTREDAGETHMNHRSSDH